MTNKTDAEILADAPEGATHCKDKPTRTDTVFYYKVSNDYWHFWSRDKWFIYHECTTFMRSLADIEALVAKDKKIAEFEKEIERLTQRINDTFDYCEAVKKALPKRDLEQQAKALHDYSKELIADAQKLPLQAESKSRGSSIYNWQMHHANNLRWRGNKILNIKAKCGDL